MEKQQIDGVELKHIIKSGKIPYDNYNGMPTLTALDDPNVPDTVKRAFKNFNDELRLASTLFPFSSPMGMMYAIASVQVPVKLERLKCQMDLSREEKERRAVEILEAGTKKLVEIRGEICNGTPTRYG